MSQVTLKSITPQIEQNIVEIARVSSSRENKSEQVEGLINYLIKHKHWSPFEHGFMTLEIKTSKAIGIQLIRHRSFTFQEFSQRYAKVTSMEPVEIRSEDPVNRQSSVEVFDPILKGEYDTIDGSTASQAISYHLEVMQSLYNSLLAAGVAKECARMILPLTTETTIYMTGSIRSWIHLIMIRDDSHAQKEIQIIAREMKSIFKQELPLISKALGY
jgi:thymidylate synthase (FAD)